MKLLRPLLLLCAALAVGALTGCGSGTMDAKEGAEKKSCSRPMARIRGSWIRI